MPVIRRPIECDGLVSNPYSFHKLPLATHRGSDVTRVSREGRTGSQTRPDTVGPHEVKEGKTRQASPSTQSEGAASGPDDISMV